MKSLLRLSSSFVLLILVSVNLQAQEGIRLLRQPSISAEHIVFTYGSDVWVAGRSGEDTFRSFHDALMTRSGGLDANKIFALAEESGLDVELLKRDMFAPSIERYIAETLMVARSLGVSGTPTYFINGRVVAGAKGYDALADAVETALEEG